MQFETGLFWHHTANSILPPPAAVCTAATATARYRIRRSRDVKGNVASCDKENSPSMSRCYCSIAAVAAAAARLARVGSC